MILGYQIFSPSPRRLSETHGGDVPMFHSAGAGEALPVGDGYQRLMVVMFPCFRFDPGPGALLQRGGVREAEGHPAGAGEQPHVQ